MGRRGKGVAQILRGYGKIRILMRLRQRLWTTAVLAGTTVLVVGVIEPTRVGEEARFDEPGAAAQYDVERRRPLGTAVDMTALYDAATAGLARLGRFSSAINRVLPDSQPQLARVVLCQSRGRGDRSQRASPESSTRGRRSDRATSADGRVSFVITRAQPHGSVCGRRVGRHLEE